MVPEEIRQLDENLSDQYLCNFSVFQSLIDHWALKQLFPIVPLQGLERPPEREARLVDITCDSDGQVDHFIDPEAQRDTLPLHLPTSVGGGPYHLGFFLMGAYQDIMGDMHNLFGRVNEVHVFLDPDEENGYYIEEVIEAPQSRVCSTWFSTTKSTGAKREKTDRLSDPDDRSSHRKACACWPSTTNGLRDQTYLSF